MNNLFKSSRGKTAPAADTKNEAGGIAYSLDPKAALAQLVCTGTFSNTFYASGTEQVDQIIALAAQTEPEFVAKCAIYARKSAFMKDTPAFLLALLSTDEKGRELMKSVFPRVIDNGKMLRNYVQVLRSGKTGRKSLGTAPKKLVQHWLTHQSPKRVFEASVGNEPSLADIIKMVHPKPQNPEQEALFAYLIGKPYKAANLPVEILRFEKFKVDGGEVPEVPFQLLTALPLTVKDWKAICINANWHMTRMNLQTFLRHGVLEDKEMVDLIAKRLADPEAVRRAKVFPYQLLIAYIMSEGIPEKIRIALQDAMEIATSNVKPIEGKLALCPDVSGSMSNAAVTGSRGTATSKVRAIHVAALVSASYLRVNPDAIILPFDTQVHKHNLNPRDSVMTNAAKLAAYGGGGTSCSLPLKQLNEEKQNADLCIYISDNESWVDRPSVFRGGITATGLMIEWEGFKSWNPRAKLVLMDTAANTTSQAPNRGADILNIGGFSDNAFLAIERFQTGESWVEVIESIPLKEDK